MGKWGRYPTAVGVKSARGKVSGEKGVQRSDK